MKVIIAGSRTIYDYSVVQEFLDALDLEITEVVSGAASGVDYLGIQWALENKISVKTFLAQWSKYGKGAGPIRNRQMAKYADALVVIWDGQSKGTKNMIDEARKQGLIVFKKEVS